MHVVNVKGEIIPQLKIKKLIVRDLSLKNIVNSAKSILYIKRLNRPVAPTVEHRTPNPGVGGSNPSGPALEAK